MLGTFGGCPARRTPNMPRLVRARSLGHVRRALRGPPRLAALADVRGVRRSPVAEGVSDRPAPTADRSAELGATMAETARREFMLGEGSGTGSGSQSLHVGVGPAHPAMHGIIRILTELDGEVILRADVEIGYLHRAFEKDCEQRSEERRVGKECRSRWSPYH